MGLSFDILSSALNGAIRGAGAGSILYYVNKNIANVSYLKVFHNTALANMDPEKVFKIATNTFALFSGAQAFVASQFPVINMNTKKFIDLKWEKLKTIRSQNKLNQNIQTFTSIVLGIAILRYTGVIGNYLTTIGAVSAVAKATFDYFAY